VDKAAGAARQAAGEQAVRGWGMTGTPVLRISDEASGEHARRVEITWQDGPARQVVVSTFGYRAGDADAEKIRWYLEPVWKRSRRVSGSGG